MIEWKLNIINMISTQTSTLFSDSQGMIGSALLNCLVHF